MADFPKFIDNNSFGLEVLKILGAAYDRAIATLHSPTEAISETIADRIIDAWHAGERDLEKICKIALHGF